MIFSNSLTGFGEAFNASQMRRNATMYSVASCCRVSRIETGFEASGAVSAGVFSILQLSCMVVEGDSGKAKRGHHVKGL